MTCLYYTILVYRMQFDPGRGYILAFSFMHALFSLYRVPMTAMEQLDALYAPLSLYAASDA